MPLSLQQTLVSSHSISKGWVAALFNIPVDKIRGKQRYSLNSASVGCLHHAMAEAWLILRKSHASWESFSSTSPIPSQSVKMFTSFHSNL